MKLCVTVGVFLVLLALSAQVVVIVATTRMTTLAASTMSPAPANTTVMNACSRINASILLTLALALVPLFSNTWC